VLCELVAWAGTLRSTALLERGFVVRRAAHVAALALLGAAAAGVTLAAGSITSPNAFAAGIAGAAAVAGLVALVWSLGRRTA
jgi:hypothetical protein